MGAKISALINEEVEAMESRTILNKSQVQPGATSLQCMTNIISCCTSPSIVNEEHASTPEYGAEKLKRSCRVLYQETADGKENIPAPPKTKIIRKRKISAGENVVPAPASTRIKKAPEKGSFLATFFKVFDDDVIQDFLWMDRCCRLADKYLLAMIYAYFRRANFTKREYTRTNFFAALYLAHDMEEDDEDLKLEIFPWVLGDYWRERHTEFLVHRDSLLKKINYRAAVSKLTCDEIMELCPTHPIWKRERREHHGGASRIYPHEEDPDFSPRGPNASPVFCVQCAECDAANNNNTAFDTSPVFTSGYLSACSMEISPLRTTAWDVPITERQDRGRKKAALGEANFLIASSAQSDDILLCREE